MKRNIFYLFQVESAHRFYANDVQTTILINRGIRLLFKLRDGSTFSSLFALVLYLFSRAASIAAQVNRKIKNISIGVDRLPPPPPPSRHKAGRSPFDCLQNKYCCHLASFLFTCHKGF